MFITPLQMGRGQKRKLSAPLEKRGANRRPLLTSADIIIACIDKKRKMRELDKAGGAGYTIDNEGRSPVDGLVPTLCN